MITKKQSNFIKLVAIVSMAVDHVGSYLFPLEILRIIGRIAFPLFAYQIGIGYKTTSSKKNYLIRLTIFGIISQIPFYLLAEKFILNILFSFILGIFTISFLENKKFLYIYIIAFFSFFVKYQIYGLAIILIFYFLKNKNFQALSFFLATLLYSFYSNWEIQIFSLLALPIIFKPFLEINLPKNFFYYFYPFHLMVIYLIKIFFF